jgi:hypothetical protein
VWKAGTKQLTKKPTMGLSFFRQYEEVAQKQNNLHSQGRQEKDD